MSLYCGGEGRETWRHMETHGDTWRHMGNMETHGDTWRHMGRHMETHGDTWRHMGNMETHGDTWRRMETHGETHGDTWRHMETHGDTWRTCKLHTERPRTNWDSNQDWLYMYYPQCTCDKVPLKQIKSNTDTYCIIRCLKHVSYVSSCNMDASVREKQSGVTGLIIMIPENSSESGRGFIVA